MPSILLLVLASLLASTGRAQETRPNVTTLTTKNIDFAMNLYHRIASYHDNNIFFSPLCMSATLATLALGAQGPTREQILKGLNLLGLNEEDRPESTLELFHELQPNITQEGDMRLEQGTALFVQQQFEVLRAFSDQIKDFFNADVYNVDYSNPTASKATINDYIKHKTGNKVTDMIDKVSPETKLMLINTIFFQGKWEHPFNKKSTVNERFYVDKYNIVQVPMMFTEAKVLLAKDTSLKLNILRLPYLGGTSMLILLPDKGVDYTAIDDHINGDIFHSWLKLLKERRMEVLLPRFKMEQSYAMHTILPDLGITNIFTNAANLSGLSVQQGLKVSEVQHKAMIEVDEMGTTAAGVTKTGITPHSLPSRITVDRPFFFLIFHEATKTLLFMGRVIDPTKM